MRRHNLQAGSLDISLELLRRNAVEKAVFVIRSLHRGISKLGESLENLLMVLCILFRIADKFPETVQLDTYVLPGSFSSPRAASSDAAQQNCHIKQNLLHRTYSMTLMRIFLYQTSSP